MRTKVIIFFILINFNVVNAITFSVDSNKILKNLRCLICQGQSVADSNSDFAQTIKIVVKDQINDGKSEKEIYDFLIEKYGEWIVYKPPFNKVNFAPLSVCSIFPLSATTLIILFLSLASCIKIPSKFPILSLSLINTVRLETGEENTFS